MNENRSHGEKVPGENWKRPWEAKGGKSWGNGPSIREKFLGKYIYIYNHTSRPGGVTPDCRNPKCEVARIAESEISELTRIA